MCERAEDPQEALANAVAALGALDLDTLSDDELHELTVSLQAASSHLGAVIAKVLAPWIGSRVWAEDGSRSAASRLAAECGISGRSAGTQLTRARKLASMPLTAAALADGKLSLDKADLLTYVNQPDVAELFARDEALLVEKVKTLRYFQALQAAKHWLRLAEDEVGKKPRDPAGRYVRAVRTFGDTVDLRGSLDAIGGSEFLTELERRERELYEADWTAARVAHGEKATVWDLSRTPDQRRADALVEMARRSAAMPAGAQRPRPLLSVLCGDATLSQICELASGAVINPGLLVPLLGDADIERIVFDGPSRVIDVGVRQPFFRGGLRRAIEVRDRHCQHPSGCDVRAEQCEIDHILPRSEGGLTVQGNGRCLCGFHNRLRPGAQRERPPPDGD